MAPSAMKAMKAMKSMKATVKPVTKNDAVESKTVKPVTKPVAKTDSKTVKTPDVGAVGCLTKAEVSKVKTMKLDDKLDFFKAKLGTTENLTLETIGDFHGLLNKLEKSTLWSRHQTMLRNSPAEQAGQAALGKKEKGLATLALCLDKGGHISAFVKNKLTVSKTHVKLEKWMPWIHFSNYFGEADAQAHYESGRLMEREDPLTPGCFEYMDRGDVSVTKSIRTDKVKQESRAKTVDDEYNMLDDMFADDQLSIGNFGYKFDQMMSIEVGKGKGKGKGAGAPSVKGTGKGSKSRKGGSGGKGTPNPLALEDATVEDQLELAIGKTRQMMTHLGKAELAITEVKAEFGKHATKNKPMLDALNGSLSSVAYYSNILKQHICRQEASDKNLNELKSKLVEAANAWKAAVDQVKKTRALMSDGGARSVRSRK